MALADRATPKAYAVKDCQKPGFTQYTFFRGSWCAQNDEGRVSWRMICSKADFSDQIFLQGNCTDGLNCIDPPNVQKGQLGTASCIPSSGVSEAGSDGFSGSGSDSLSSSGSHHAEAEPESHGSSQSGSDDSSEIN